MFDILIINCCAVTMDPKRRILPRCSIAIKDGVISAIGDQISGKAVKVIDGGNCYALPGLINSHTHVYQALLEGIGYDMHFNSWNIRFFIITSKHGLKSIIMMLMWLEP